MTDSDDAQRWRTVLGWIRSRALMLVVSLLLGVGGIVLGAALTQGDHGARIAAAAEAITEATHDRASITARVRALESTVSGVRSEVRLLIRWTVPRQAWPAGMDGDE